ncbi:MAG TPA: hypothetical protein G4O11_11820 [Anaerolineae bacterium]|nr:hypothetical protein [Anaerolineae bacterium]
MRETNISKLPEADEVRFRTILADQIARYPQMEVQDLYKLILQATMGSEHAISSVDAARSWLRRELAGLPEGPEEPISDVISSDGIIVRVNLRPFIQSGGDPSSLLDAFVRTANEYWGTEERLLDHWFFAVQMTEDGELPFEPSQMRAFFKKVEEDGFPAVHHSTRYEEAYHPAYRVIKQEFLAEV